jgi:3-hydroxyisobutyrate dehydrogenase-like beta-hydroxyacid dehydrogenase
MGVENGLSLETCTAGLQKGSARGATTELALPKLLKGDFSVSLTLALMHKDVRLATKLGRQRDAYGIDQCRARAIPDGGQRAWGQQGHADPR